jgi:hypothetical protein
VVLVETGVGGAELVAEVDLELDGGVFGQGVVGGAVVADDVADGVAILYPCDDSDFEIDGGDGVALDGVVFSF